MNFNHCRRVQALMNERDAVCKEDDIMNGDISVHGDHVIFMELQPQRVVGREVIYSEEVRKVAVVASDSTREIDGHLIVRVKRQTIMEMVEAASQSLRNRITAIDKELAEYIGE